MEKWKEMAGSRRVLLIILAAMAVGFTVIYAATGLRSGIQYRNSFLPRTEQEGNIVYSGTVKMKDTSFTVTPQGQVILQVGENTFGPFTVIEDDTVPFGREGDWKVAISKGDELIFRGIIRKISDEYWMMEAEGEMWHGDSPFYIGSDSTYGTKEWKDLPYNLMARLVVDPPIILRGNWEFYWFGLLITALNAVTVIWEDKLFRFHMSFRVRDVERVEPSDWELTSRWLSWVSMTLIALFVFCMGFTL